MYVSVNVTADDLEYDADDLLEMLDALERLESVEQIRFWEKALSKHPNPKEIIRMVLQNLDFDSSANLLDELRQEFLSYAEYKEKAEALKTLENP